MNDTTRTERWLIYPYLDLIAMIMHPILTIRSLTHLEAP